MYIKKIYTTVFVGILFTLNFAISQSYNFENYTVEDGLPQSEVNDLYQDERGYLWIATSGGGICSFDGINFVQYEERNGLSGQIVTSLTGDDKGNIWAGTTWGGLSCFDGKNFRIYNKDKGLSGNSVNCLAFDKKNNLIVAGTDFGVSFINDNKITNIYVQGTDTLPLVNSIFVYEGITYAGTINGLFTINEKGFKKIDHEFFNSKSIHSITADEKDNLWFAVNRHGVIKMKHKTKEFIYPEINEKLIGKEIQSLLMDNRYGLLIGTANEALYIYDGHKLNHFGNENGLKTNSIGCIVKDFSGKIWMGTTGSGLIGFYSRAFTYFNSFEGLGNGDIFSILIDKKKNVWAASYGTGVFCYDGKTTKKYDESNGLIHHSVRQMVMDEDGNIWMATKGGLSKFDGKKFTNYTTKDGLPGENLRCVAIDDFNNVWVGTNGQGAAKFDGKKFKTYTEENGLGHNYIHSILCDTKKNIWFGSGNGIDKLSPDGKINHYSTQDGLCNSYVGSIIEDHLGSIWLATDRCVSKFTGSRFKNYSVEQGLASSTIYLIQFDDKGDLWVGTNKGVDRLDFDRYGSVTRIKHYGKAEGFLGVECNARAVTKDGAGNLWFGTVKGIIRFKPGEDHKNAAPPLIHITDVKLFYKNASWNKLGIETNGWFNLPVNPEFRYDQNQLVFEFNAISNILPEKNTYSYKLEGFDPDWSPFVSSNSVSYSNLPAGEYTFKVRAKNCDGVISEKIAEFSFTIHPAFWQTWWFYSLLLLGVVYLIYRYNSTLRRHAATHNSLLEQRVELRTKEILKQKEEKDVLLKEVHHRVKNNMQVITSLLNIQSWYIKDPESLKLIAESKNRIKSMALIHEKLYESKEFSRINFADYIDSLVSELISAYGINQEIVVDKKIESENFSIDTIIPLGLLINEIISNSLKYAFDGKEKGEILIQLSNHPDGYHLIIGDNGKGIPKNVLDNESTTLGLELIKLLTDQLNGHVKILEREGTYFEVIFKGNE